MHAFLHTVFWLSVLSACFRLLILGAREYPVKTRVTLGEDLGKLVENVIWVVWAGVLLWGCK